MSSSHKTRSGRRVLTLKDCVRLPKGHPMANPRLYILKNRYATRPQSTPSIVSLDSSAGGDENGNHAHVENLQGQATATTKCAPKEEEAGGMNGDKKLDSNEETTETTERARKMEEAGDQKTDNSIVPLNDDKDKVVSSNGHQY